MTFKQHFNQMQKFLHSDFRRPVLFTAAMLISSVVMGYLAGEASPEAVEQAMNAFMQMVEQAGIVLEEGEISVFALLSNNWQAMMMAMLYGALPFLFVPGLVLIANGMLAGMLCAWFLSQGGSMTAYLMGILPHGVFELYALILAAACGNMICRCFTARCLKRPSSEPAVNTLIHAMEVLLFAVAPLTVIAAFIETYITPVLLQQFL